MKERRTKIVATIGPSSNDDRTLRALIKSGVNVCRLNFSFGTHHEHKHTIERIRRIAESLRMPVAILQDLQGPKIRIGTLRCPVTLKRGDTVVLSGQTAHRDELVLPTSYTKIADDSKAGQTILLADGSIILKVTQVDRDAKQVICTVKNGGTVVTGKGINLPYTNISLPSLTKKDREDARFGASMGVDYIALSFVREAKDVHGLRHLLNRAGASMPIIAKIEKPEALAKLDSILEAADGAMVARGDLAVEISMSRVPLAQKEIIRRANEKGKITITATQMLESMIEHPVPTRAEASDVANAILDGTDAVMLSGETATGKYPIKAVRAMSDIAREIEGAAHSGDDMADALDVNEHDILRDALCSSAAYLSYMLDERGLAVFTQTGSTVRILSKYRPDTTIFAGSYDTTLFNRMALYHNVCPVLLKKPKDDTQTLQFFLRALKEQKHISSRDKIIVLTGDHSRERWSTNMIRVMDID